MALREAAFSSLRWTAVTKLIGQVANWAITLIVIRLLVPADYGLMAMANVAIGLLAMLAGMGFSTSLVQAKTLDVVHVREIWGAAFIANGVICAALAAAAPAIAAFYAEPQLTAIIQVLALQFLLSAVAIPPEGMLRREFLFKRLSIVEMSSAVLGNAVTLALAFSGMGVWSLVFGALTGALARAALLHVAHPLKVLPLFTLHSARDLVSFGAALTFTRILWYLFSQADIVIAGKLLGQYRTGLYSVAVHLASLPMQHAQSMANDVAFSAFAKIQHDKRAIAANLRLAIRLVAILAFPALWGLAVVAPEVVRLVLGPQWLETILPLQIIALVIPLRMIGTIVSTTIISVGRVDVAMLTTLIGVVVAPVLFYFGSRYGVTGLALTWVVVTPFMLVLNLSRSLPAMGVSIIDVVVEIWRPMLASAVMLAALFLLRIALDFASDGLRFAVLMPAGILLYALATVTINRPAASEAWHLLVPRRIGS